MRNIHPHSERDSVAPSEKECTRAPCDDGNRGGAGQLGGWRAVTKVGTNRDDVPRAPSGLSRFEAWLIIASGHSRIVGRPAVPRRG